MEMTTREKAYKKIVNIITNDEVIDEAIELARFYNIVLTEIWEEDEIVGMMVEDEPIYF